jgi:chromate transporter
MRLCYNPHTIEHPLSDPIPMSAAPHSTLKEIAVWLRVGLFSFGGPAAHIALIHSEIVERLGWADRRTFAQGLSFATMLPGPEAQQLATYLGWHYGGLRGGMIAGLGFVLPGAAIMIALTLGLATVQDTALIEAVFSAIRPVIVAFIVVAIWRLRAQSLSSPVKLAVAVCAFIALWWFDVPFPLVLAAAVGISMLVPDMFHDLGDGDVERQRPDLTDTRTPLRRAAVIAAIGTTIWLATYLAAAGTLGAGFAKISEQISTAVVIVFGGAYALVGYIADQAVESLGLLTARQIADGLALAEGAPGPLILFNTYVGTLVSATESTGWAPAVAGGLVATIFTFLPSFVLVLAAAPFVQILAGFARINAALAAISAAVIGLIANLAILIAVSALWHDGEPNIEGVILAVLSMAALLLTRLPAPALILLAAVYGFLRWTLVAA